MVSFDNYRLNQIYFSRLTLKLLVGHQIAVVVAADMVVDSDVGRIVDFVVGMVVVDRVVVGKTVPVVGMIAPDGMIAPVGMVVGCMFAVEDSLNGRNRGHC